jgi:hypothetical protein
VASDSILAHQVSHDLLLLPLVNYSYARTYRVDAAEVGHAQLIGMPTGERGAPPFCRDRLDCGGVVWRHHRRCRDYE